MEIRILGTRGEITESAPRHSRHSGVLVDDRIMFDLGEKDFLKHKPESVFITHLHPDHAFFVSRGELDTDIPVYAPEQSEKFPDVIPFTGIVHLDQYEIMSIPTHHSKLVKSVGYLVEKGTQKFLYTGDVIWINGEYHHLLQKLDLVITDGSYMRKGGMVRRDKITGQIYGHNGIPDLVSLFRRFTRHILLVHFGGWFYRNVAEARNSLRELGKNYNVAIHIGYDGMELDLNNLK